VIAVDTNILVYSHRRDSEFHSAAAAKVRELAEGRAPWALPWPCLHEFFSIVTHPRIYDPPSRADLAIDQIDAWLETASAVLLSEGDMYWPRLRGLLADGKIADGEVKFLHELRGKHPLFSSLQDPQGLVRGVRDSMASRGVDAVLEEIAAIVVDKDYRELCFRLCAEMMEADADAGGEEADALGTLQVLFGYKQDDVKRILSGVDHELHKK